MPRPWTSSPFSTAGVRRLLLLTALVSAILGVRFRLIESYGSDLPYWDQWDGEATDLYRPYLQGRLGVGDFFAPHNEHRIVLGRLLSMGLFLADNRHWNPKTQMLATSVLAAILALAIAGPALRRLPPWTGAGFAAMTALFLAMVAAWENTLWGFQSQFYFLLLAGVLHLRCTLFEKKGSLAWWLAPLAGLAGLFSMASGVLSSVAILGAVLFRALRERKFERGDGYVLGTTAAFVGAGWFLRVSVPGHAPMMAQSFAQGLAAGVHELAWPVAGFPWAALLRLLPPGALAVLYWRRQVESGEALVLLGATGWCWLQSAAIAYGRGALDYGVVSRYTEILGVGILANLLTLALVVSVATRFRRFWIVTATVCVAATLSGLAARNAEAFETIVQHLPAIHRARTAAVRAYEVAHDPSFLNKRPWWEVPFPSAAYLIPLLDDPRIREILPSSVRSTEAQPNSAPFSWVAARTLSAWPWFLICGAIVGAAGILTGLPKIKGTPIAYQRLGSGFRLGLVAAMAALAASPPFLSTPNHGKEFFFFEVNLTSDRQTLAQVYYDRGQGFNERDSSTVPVSVVGMPATYRLPLPSGTLRALRFDPTNQVGQMTIAFARIVDGAGHEWSRFGPKDFVSVQQIAAVRIDGEALHIETAVHADDPITRMVLGPPLVLPWGPRPFIEAHAPAWAALGCLGILVGAAIGRRRSS